VNGKEARHYTLDALRSTFRPEFLNRVDEVVVFHSLTQEHLKQIVNIQLNRVRKLLADRHLGLEVTDEAKAFLAREGWDPAYGARPLKRALQRELQDPLALKILQGEFNEGDIIRVDVGEEALTFTAVAQGDVVAE
jgi:ATP-dependent Clp protease ATP-binding subunit ClpB